MNLEFKISPKEFQKILKMASASNLAEFEIKEKNLIIKNYTPTFNAYFEINYEFKSKQLISNDFSSKKLVLDISNLGKILSVIKSPEILVKINYAFLELICDNVTLSKIYFLDKTLKELKDLPFENNLQISEKNFNFKLKLLKMVNNMITVTLNPEKIEFASISEDKTSFSKFQFTNQEVDCKYNSDSSLVVKIDSDLFLEKFLNLVTNFNLNFKFKNNCYLITFSNLENISGRLLLATNYN